MTTEGEVSDSAPSDDAADIVESAKTYTALSVFELNIRRIRLILELAQSGIKDDTGRATNLLSKFSSASPSPDSNYNGDKVKKSENGSVQINFTEEEIELVKRTISYRLSFVMDLPFYLHNVLLVAAWSAMEGYVQALLAQMYTRYPDLLSSEKKVTFAEIISSGENLIGYLVAKEIDDVGRKNFGDLQSYLGSKIKLQFSNKYVKALYDAYFLRNVIAHSAGFLRDDQLELVPRVLTRKDQNSGSAEST
jgi:hypothetical protein